MFKRIAAAGLWFLAALYAGSMLHAITGLPDFVGVGVALFSAAVIVAGPFHRPVAARIAVAAPGEPRIWPADIQPETPTT